MSFERGRENSIESRRTRGIVRLVTVSTCHVDLVPTMDSKADGDNANMSIELLLDKSQLQIRKIWCLAFRFAGIQIPEKDDLIARGCDVSFLDSAMEQCRNPPP